jgi:glycine/D-amino acid oxidase-like deaminating enzyme
MTFKSVDYIIIGQGLAGSAVAVQLLKKGKRILVIDQPATNRASRVAAGLFNPITGRRPVKTWMVDTLFPYLFNYYRSVEEMSQQKFFFPIPIYRPFLNIEEQNEWMALSADTAYAKFIGDVYTKSAFPHWKDDRGGLLLKAGGYIDTVRYMEAVRTLVERNGIYIEEEINDSEIIVSRDSVRFRQFEAGAIVFCRGTHRCSWFAWLPIRPLKGETLTVQSSHYQELIVNRGVYIVPGIREGMWRVGATYNSSDMSETVTSSGRQELQGKLDELVRFPVNIVDQDWGIRPTTPDRRPLLGRHPEQERTFDFNGLVTKGVSLAPYWSEAMVRYMENGQPLNKEVDIERYKSLYWTSPN